MDGGPQLFLSKQQSHLDKKKNKLKKICLLHGLVYQFNSLQVITFHLTSSSTLYVHTLFTYQQAATTVLYYILDIWFKYYFHY